MKLVIDIPEEDYNGICHLKNTQLQMLPKEVAETLIRIANGTPHETVTEFADRCRECGSSIVDKHVKNETNAMLDKIRDEIEEYKSRQLTLAIGVDDLEKGKQIALEYVLAILDKYKLESEVSDADCD